MPAEEFECHQVTRAGRLWSREGEGVWWLNS